MYDITKMQAHLLEHVNLQTADMATQNLAIDSSLLFGHGDVVYIQHNGGCYLLRRTRSGKLILTK
ncbi:MAG: hemin uptake protein HemP [Nitrosomonas sp.]|nr:hemin uptake protein HemP [Nitrosomonas sp.]